MVGHQQLHRELEQRVPGGEMATLLRREGEHDWLYGTRRAGGR